MTATVMSDSMTGHRPMPTLTIPWPATATAGRSGRDPLVARDDIFVAERALSGDGEDAPVAEPDAVVGGATMAEFEAVAGPFSTWHRTGRVAPDGSAVDMGTY